MLGPGNPLKVAKNRWHFIRKAQGSVDDVAGGPNFEDMSTLVAWVVEYGNRHICQDQQNWSPILFSDGIRCLQVLFPIGLWEATRFFPATTIGVFVGALWHLTRYVRKDVTNPLLKPNQMTSFFRIKSYMGSENGCKLCQHCMNLCKFIQNVCRTTLKTEFMSIEKSWLQRYYTP